MGPKQAIATCLRKYVTFSGRASRSEFWWFAGALWLGSMIAAVIDTVLFGGPSPDGGPAPGLFAPLFSIATFVPGLAAGWRRMHDTGRMGLYVLYPVTIMIGLAFFAGIFESTGLLTYESMSGLFRFVVIATGLLFLSSPFVVLWWLTRPSQPGTNSYGPNPHEVMP